MKSPQLLIAGSVLFCQFALAHAPVFDCYIERDDRVKCEAGYTDGSSALGRKVQVRDARDKVLLEGSIGQDNTFTFQAPAENYSVVFLGGDAHDATLQSSDITR